MSYKTNEYKIEFSGIEKAILSMIRFNKEHGERATQLMVEHMSKAVDESTAEARARGWKLADSIMMVDSGEGYVTAGCLAWWSIYPEFGTINQVARPFWRPFVWSEYYSLLGDFIKLHKELFD